MYKHLIILLCVILLRESNAHAEKDDVVDEILESLDENDDKDNGDDSNNNKSMMYAFSRWDPRCRKLSQ